MAGWETKDVVVVVAAVISAAVSLAGPFINHFLSQRRYGPEKIWEVRRDVYGKITFDLNRGLDAWGELLLDGSPADREWGRRVYAGWDAIDDAIKTQMNNYLICSPAFSKLLSKLPNNEQYIEVGRPPNEDMLENDRGAVKAIHDEL
jgi:hypothetical protein